MKNKKKKMKMETVAIKHDFVNVEEALGHLQKTQTNILEIIKKINRDIKPKVEESFKYKKGN